MAQSVDQAGVAEGSADEVDEDDEDDDEDDDDDDDNSEDDEDDDDEEVGLVLRVSQSGAERSNYDCPQPSAMEGSYDIQAHAKLSVPGAWYVYGVKMHRVYGVSKSV